MRPIDIAGLVTLALLWGFAHLFMHSAVPAFGPVPMVSLRMLGLAIGFAGVALLVRGRFEMTLTGSRLVGPRAQPVAPVVPPVRRDAAR